MNQLPQIFRQTQSTFNRQGPFFNLRLNQTFYKNTSVSLEKSASKKKTQLKVTRYSVDRPQRENVKRPGYKTISYDHFNDPQFYGTKGKKDQSESYNVLIQQRYKAAEIVGLKVAGCRGFKQQFISELKQIEKKYKIGMKCVQNSYKQQLSLLRHTISDLRRQTWAQIKSMKLELKQFNSDLIFFCEEFKRVDKNYIKCKESIDKMVLQ